MTLTSIFQAVRNLFRSAPPPPPVIAVEAPPQRIVRKRRTTVHRRRPFWKNPWLEPVRDMKRPGVYLLEAPGHLDIRYASAVLCSAVRERVGKGNFKTERISKDENTQVYKITLT